MIISNERRKESLAALRLWSEYLIRIVLVGIGTSGIMEILISCAAHGVQSSGIFLFSWGLAAIFAAVFYQSNSWKVCIVPAGLLIMLGIWKYSLIADGMTGIVNDILKLAKDTYSIEYDNISIGGFDGSTFNNSRTMALMFMAVIIVFFVTVVVTYVENMIGAVLIVAPFILLFAVFNILPDTLSVVMCTTFVFGVSANRHRGNYIQTAVVLVVSCAAALLCISFVPTDDFKRADVFDRANIKVQQGLDYIYNNGTLSGGTAHAGMDNGKLGRIDSIRYNDKKILTLTTADIGKNQYFPEFIGMDYNDNSWENNQIDEPVHITDEIVYFLEKYPDMRDYIDGGSGEFYDIVDRYRYSLSYENLDKTRDGNAYSINVDNFGVFYKLFSEESNDEKYYNPFNIIKYDELYYRKQVYDRYLDVPDSIKSIVRDMLGDITCTTAQEKESYINNVKNYLRDNYTYSSSPGRVPDGKDFITYFLTESKNGYCTYFASSAVMMLRSAGIPARYVEGYALTANQVTDGIAGNGLIQRYTGEKRQHAFDYQTRTLAVTDRAAHAWAEAYMDGYGWVTVETTPGSASFGVSSLDLTQAIVQKNNNNATDVNIEDESLKNQEETAPERVKNEDDTKTKTEVQTQSQQTDNNNVPDNVNSINRRTFMVIITICAIIAVISGIVIAGIYDSRKKKIQRCVDNGDVLYMYTYLERILKKSGLERMAGMDYKEYAAMLDEKNSICYDNDIIHIMDCVLECRFSPDGMTDDNKPDRIDVANKMNNIIYGLRHNN